MSDRSQDFATHRRWVPAYHFFTMPVLLVNLVYWVMPVFSSFSLESILAALVAVALFILALLARVFAGSVQDRVIRLEERLRLERLLPDDLKRRTDEFSVRQLVGLRFASDEELPGLAKKVLDGNIEKADDIKRQIKTWRPDFQRI